MAGTARGGEGKYGRGFESKIIAAHYRILGTIVPVHFTGGAFTVVYV